MNADRRLAALRRRLEGSDFDAVVVSRPVNVAYVTGFEGVFDTEDAHAAVITADVTWLYTDSRYNEAASRAAADTPWGVRAARDSLYATVCEDLASAGIAALAVEDSVPYARFRFISEQFPGRVDGVDSWVEAVREVKEPDELARVAAAQELTDRTFDHILGLVRPGVTEREIALELEVFMRRNGSDGVAFDPIVASGPNSALPHATVTDRPFSAGDFVKMDFGARVEGYCADMTRTVVIGRASDRQREMYEAVRAANVAGIGGVRAGRAGKDIDAEARAVIVERGFGEYFGHGLGHGVGLEVHELPGVGPRGTKAVPAGSVITVEPGVYLPGFGGVRIEDLVVVEEDGARVLTRSTKDLIEL